MFERHWSEHQQLTCCFVNPMFNEMKLQPLKNWNIIKDDSEYQFHLKRYPIKIVIFSMAVHQISKHLDIISLTINIIKITVRRRVESIQRQVISSSIQVILFGCSKCVQVHRRTIVFTTNKSVVEWHFQIDLNLI